MIELTVVFESQINSPASQTAWEQGMWLLLNACDVEMQVQAIFMQDPRLVPLALGKKLQQLDLYEVPCCMLESVAKSAQDMDTLRNFTSHCQLPAAPLDAAHETQEAQATSGNESLTQGNDLDWDFVELSLADAIASKLAHSLNIVTV